MAERFQKLSLLFKALSDKNRLKILAYIQKRDLKCRLNKEGKCKDRACIKDLQKHLKISMPTVSHHVKELSTAELIAAKKQGQWSYLRIDQKHFKEINNFISLFY